MKNEMPLLAYEKEQLSPYMSMEAIDFHYGKHLQTYVDNVQKMTAGTPQADMSLEELVKTLPEGALLNNAAQVMNHTLFFTQFCSPQKALGAPLGNVAKAVEQSFGSFEEMKKQLSQAAVGLFGSGWAWLAMNKHGKLEVKAMSNAGNPLREGLVPLLCIDVWEHAYYIDYRNRRAEYVDLLWNLIDWVVVEERYDLAVEQGA